jgi:hypothetical protein
MQCCPSSTGFFCAPISSACGQVPASMGQALSKAAVGRVQTSAGDAWVAFFASGYNRLGIPNVGQSIYAVNALTGVPMGTWNLPDVPGPSGSGALSPSLVAGVKLVDADGDGYVDRLYVGDLAGRMWKLNTWAKAAVAGTGTMGDPNQWPTCLLYDAGAVAPGGRGAAPIVSTAGVAVFDTEAVNVYFGTGGDDSAPSDQSYTFFGIRDSDGLNVCSNGQHTGPLIASMGEFALQDPAAGFRFWAEPTVVDGLTVYFSSFSGSLERIQDLANLESQQSHLYGIAIRPFTDSSGRVFRAGQSVLSGGTAFFQVNSALRTAPMVRGQTVSSVTRAVNPAALTATPKDLLIQEGEGNVLRLTTSGAQLNKPPALKQVRWRQVIF